MPSLTDGLVGGRVVRHHLVDRIYHWTMAASVLTLMVTAFLPILGIKFDWVMIHWIAGIVLAVAVIIHIVRAVIWQDLRSMIIWIPDIRDAFRAVIRFVTGSGTVPEKPGKYPLLQKAYHWGISAVMLGVIASGILMMAKIDSPWWRRNPYFLENSWWSIDFTWGVVYTVHGLCAMAAVSLVMIHVYFAIRPEKLWITRSMILGWITQQEYRNYHSTSRWVADPKGNRSEGPAPRAAE